MNKKLEDLNELWDRFNYSINTQEEMTEKDFKKYQKMMAETFALIKEEWKNDKVSKDLCLFFTTFAQFPDKGYDNEGNCLYGEFYEIASQFHNIFITNMFNNEQFNYDDDGNLILVGYEDNEIKINPETFELPDIDEIYGL